MLKAVMKPEVMKSGKATLILGVTADNVLRLTEEKPMFIEGDELGVSHDIVIYYGATEKRLLDQLLEAGVTLPDAQ